MKTQEKRQPTHLSVLMIRNLKECVVFIFFITASINPNAPQGTPSGCALFVTLLLVITHTGTRNIIFFLYLA